MTTTEPLNADTSGNASVALPDQKHLRNVALLGALGGLFSWAVATFWLNHAQHYHIAVDPVLSTAVGAGAGIVYVFLIANTDRDDTPRIVALALLAGFFWEPVLQAGSVLIDKQKDERKVAAASAQVQEAVELARTLSSLPADEKPLVAGEIQGKVNEAAILASEVDSLSRLNELTESTAVLAEELERVEAPAVQPPPAELPARITRDPVGLHLDRVDRALRHLRF